MDSVVSEWLHNAPYTHSKKQLKSLIMLLCVLAPNVSYTKARRVVYAAFDKAMKGDLGRVWMRDRCVRRTIRVYGMNDQRTSAWHMKRGEMITASEVWKVFVGGETRRSLIVGKLTPPQSSGGQFGGALIWGTRFEPIAKEIYEQETGCTITDVSCVQHPVYPFLGASPDGIVFPTDASDIHRRGRLIEFKCPISRPESEGVPSEYVHQMQMQMECTGIDECEYAEFRFKQVFSSEWVRATGVKGVFAVFDDEKVEYKSQTEDLVAWQKKVSDRDPQFLYWLLKSSKKAFVPKDPTWITTHIPELQAAWDEVLLHRSAGTTPPPPPSKVVSLDI